ncbi:MAG TPA: hypothetical protein VLT33_23310 [Labilithrix sp.]|nr:hypothetical protein [Labilithrix sp.]
MARLLASILLASAAVAASAVGCSSSSETPAKPAAPTWDGAPVTLDVYDGRLATVAVAIASSDPSKLTVTATTDAGEAELAPAEAPSTDGVWHGTIKLRPGYALPAGAAGTVTVDVRDAASGAALQRSIALQAHKLSWKKRVTWAAASGPQTREHGAFLRDDAAKAVYLLQGSGYNPQFVPIADSWRLDVAAGTWAAWTPTGDVPPAAGSRRVTPIPGGGAKFYTYGGYVGSDATADDDPAIYRIDLADTAHTFTKLTSVGAGPGRELHAFAYDAKSETFVVTGGVSAKTQEVYEDTWTIKIAGDTATWSPLAAQKGPTGRYGAFTAFDAESRRLVVWSGAQQYETTLDPVNPAQDAWALDFSVDPPAWSKLEPTGTAPKGRRNGCGMADPAGRRLFVYGGTGDGKTTEKGLFVLDLEPGHESWTKLDLANAPPIRSSGFGFATPEGDVTCAFGNDDRPYADIAYLGYADAVK